MAITRVQQTQISGSLSQDDTLAAGSDLGAKSTLKGDLDALRSQVKRIVGGANWYTALEGSQDLADIYAGIRFTGANADLQGTLDVTGAAVFDSTLSVVGNSTLLSADIGGGFGSTGVSISSAGDIQANGALEIGGASMLSGSLNVLGASQFAAVNASGAVALASTLGVAGMASLNGGISVESGRLAVTDGGVGVTMNGLLGVTGAVVLSSTLQAGGSTLASLTVSGASSLAAVGASGAASFLSTMGVIGAISAASPSNSFNGLSVTGSAGLSVSSDLLVGGNATVNGDLFVKGSTTYIQTDNLLVKDAFIYLATGSAGTTNSGIVFSKGAGASFDLVIGQDGGAGEVVFSKHAHSSSMDSPSGSINGATLVPAWMSMTKIGAIEGTLVGSISKDGNDFLVKSESGAKLLLTALGDEAFDLAADGHMALFDTAFTATTIIGALLETKAAVVTAGSGGNISKVSYAGNSAAISAGVLTFIAQTLASADHKLVDVFLNGVMLSPVNDLTAITTTSVTIAAGIASSLIADDVIVVIARG